MITNFIKWKSMNENRSTEEDHFIEYFKSIKTMETSKYKSHSSPNKEINNVKDEALEMLMSEETEYDMMEIMMKFATYVSPEYDEDGIWDKDFVESLDEDFDPENVYRQASFKDLKSNFSEDGYQMFLKHVYTIFNSDSYEMISTVEEEFSKGGYVDIWRAVVYKTEDLSKIKNKFEGVGVYWSWDEDSAESYHSEFRDYDITLHGKATTESIDWKNSLYKNVYTLKCEKEIQLKDKSSIMIVGFHDNKSNKYVKLDEPIVVKA